VDHAVGQTETCVDPGVEVAGDALHPARPHEGDQLAVAGVEEDVLDLAALGDLEHVAADSAESECVLVEVESRRHVARGEPEVGEAQMPHAQTSCGRCLESTASV
jgi:hypothetical protein